MDFAHSEEQLMLRDSARSWLADRYPAEVVARLADDIEGTGSEPGVWAELERMGWLDAAAAGVTEAGLLLEQTAAGLLPAPFFATVALAAPFGADTSVPTTLAWAEDGAPRLGDAVATTVDAAGRVTGHKHLVPDLGTTTHAVVTTTDGPRLVALANAEIHVHSTIDRTRRLGDLVLAGTPSTALPRPDLDAVRARLLTLAACESVGIAQRVLDISVPHVSTREQFGRKIGTYQGVSHPLADLFTALELSRSLTVWACWAIDAGDPSAAVAAASAKAMAGPAAVRACETAIQVHGGLGFTWDSPLHRYYKRAHWLDALEGGGGVQRAAVAAAILDVPAAA